MERRVIGALGLVLRLALGGIFLTIGALHAWDAPRFVLAFQNYDLLPPDASMVFGVYLPWVEILAALGLLARRLYLGSLAALGGMLLIFLAAIVSAWQRGLDITCGCWREGEKVATHFPQLVARDATMLAAVAVLVAIEWRRCAVNSKDNLAERL